MTTIADYGAVDSSSSNNEWADYWRYHVGVNVIPANSKEKMPIVAWKEFQDNPVPEELHNQWKEDRLFDQGIAVITGKVWHRKDIGDCSLVGIDCDNLKAIQELLTRNGRTITPEQFANNTIVEQHMDSREKMHVYVYTNGKSLRDKTSDIGHLSENIDPDSVPIFEVKASSKYLMYCCPSRHKNGHKYQILGTRTPLKLNDGAAEEWQEEIDAICRKYGLGVGGESDKIPIPELFKDDTIIYQSHNRHEALLRAMESLIQRNRGILSQEQIAELAMEWNQKHCSPPLDDKEFARQWKSALDFISKNTDSDNGIDQQQQQRQSVSIINNDQKKKEEEVQRYILPGYLLESVTIGLENCFATAVYHNSNDKTEVSLAKEFELDEKTIVKPIDDASNLNKPYHFESKEEFYEVLDKARNATLDTIYKEVKSIWNKYIDADDTHITICAADTVFTYFQDRLGLTHYVFFVGDNDSGKSNNLTVFQLLGYRNMTSSDITSANIYQFLGSRDEGAGTICEDEADNIDNDHDKMRIYKNGYITGRYIYRTDTSFGRRQYRFNTFCFKAFAAERLPDPVKAKGFIQRIVRLNCTAGFRQDDISEVVNPAGAEEFEDLLKELNDVRNLLLCYRLLHFRDKIPNIDINLRNREKQLFKPVLRLFQGTETFEELRKVIARLVREKRETKANTLHAFLYQLIRNLVIEQNSLELSNALIWNRLKAELDANEIPNRPQSCDTAAFGMLSQKTISCILQDVFDAKPSRDKKDRKWTFNKHNLDRLKEVYEFNVDIEIENERVTHKTLVTLVGIERHFAESAKVIESAENKIESEKTNNGINENDTLFVTNSDSENHVDSKEVSQASKVSPAQATSQQLAGKPEIYFLNGWWHCSSCKAKGDNFWKKDHNCNNGNGNGKEEDRKN